MLNFFSQLNILTVNFVSNVSSSFFWWHILLIVLGVVFFGGIIFLMIVSIHLRRKKLKRETKKIPKESQIFWNDR
ncbi:MAG: hypothetical protein FWE22_07000 [Firmicutes bacterium]|nr:hypothetical protein [Bacillota bacterium]